MAKESEQLVDEEKMQKMSVAPPDPEANGKAAKQAQKRQNKELEEGLKESFPASDPPANTQPGHDQPVPSSGAPKDQD